MDSHFYHMTLHVGAFVLASLLFMVMLAGYRRCCGNRCVKLPHAIRDYLLRANFLKLCFMFSAFYFSIWVGYAHMGVSCDMLDREAQCQCYGLEVLRTKPLKEKLHWAENGRRMCLDSKFFANFIKSNTARNE